MAARRNTTPLFEIVSRNGNAGTPVDRTDRPAEPVPPGPVSDRAAPEPPRPAPAPPRRVPGVIEEPPSPRPASAPTSDIHEPTPDPVRDMPRTMGRISVASGTVRLPINYVYIGLSGVLILGLVVWTLGYVFGNRSAEEKARREIESATGGPAPRDPLAEAGSNTGNPTPSPGRSGPGTDAPRAEVPASGGGGVVPVDVPPGLPAITDRRTGFLAPGGYFEAEPRQAGLNYLCLVSRLPEADAVRAIDFLARQGVVAVGVEPERVDANNRVYALYTLQGLTRSEYARENGSPVRDHHETLLAELGRRWRAEERGTSDFSRPQWYRFSP